MNDSGIELPRTLELPCDQAQRAYLVVNADTNGFQGLASLALFLTRDGGSIGTLHRLRPDTLEDMIETLEEAKRQVEACDEEGGLS